MLSGSPLGAEVVSSRVEIPVSDFVRLAPLGGLTSASLETPGFIEDAECNELDFTLSSEVGESFAAIVTPTNPAAVLTIEYVEGQGTLNAASEPGGAAILATTKTATPGAATIRVTSNLPTELSIDVYRNTIIEAASGNSRSSNRVDLSSSRLTAGRIDRYAAIGSTSLVQNDQTILSDSFEGASSFLTDGLWHISSGRANDGQPNHAGRGLYFGHAELRSMQSGTLNWDAQLDSTSNGRWEATNNGKSANQWTFSPSSNPTTGAPANLNGIEEWYEIGPAATLPALETSRGDLATQDDASFELVFRPLDFVGTHVLFETGGNSDGTAILLDGKSLEVRVQDSDDPDRRVIRNHSFDDTQDADKFHHIVVTIRPAPDAGTNEVRLFVNGVEAGSPTSAVGVLADWSGTDGAGLGRANGDFADSNDTALTGNFEGDIALIRYHEGRLLGVGEVAATYEDLQNDLDYVVGNYNTGAAVNGNATSPTISLSAGAEYTLSFDTLIEVEDAEEPFERLQVIVQDVATNAETVVVDRFDGSLPVNTLGAWTDIEVDLSPFAGNSIKVLFRFDSVDENRNDFEGWWIDNFRVIRSLTPTTTDEDYYTVDLSDHVGDSVDIVLAGHLGTNYSDQALELRAPNGSLVASGVPSPIQTGTTSTNYDLGILGYQVTSGGQYSIRVVSNAATSGSQYGIVVSPNVAIETEPNDGSSPLRVFTATDEPNVSGYLRSEASQLYIGRSAFNADNPGLILEDFEDGVVSPTGIVTFAGPLGSQTNNAAFPSGIAAGVSISGQRTNDLALVGPNFYEDELPGSHVVGPDSFADHTTIEFTTPVTAVSFDLFTEGFVTIKLYDENGQTISRPVVTAEPMGTFIGLTSSLPIKRVEIEEALQRGELIDNLQFGTAGVQPTPNTDAFTLSLSAGQTVQISTATPLDAVLNSPTNSLDPSLEVIGPGLTLSDQNSSADGKNAQLTVIAPVDGDYLVRVAAESGEGEYVVRVEEGTKADAVRGYLDYENFIVVEGTGQEAFGLDVIAADSNLVPTANATPFGFALASMPGHITFGNLGEPTVLDGTYRTTIHVADGNATNIEAFWGNFTEPVAFDIEQPSCDNYAFSIMKVDACATKIAERDLILAELGTIAGDLNGDRRVDFGDFLQLSVSFGGDGKYTQGDIDVNGTVGFADFLALSANFGREP